MSLKDKPLKKCHTDKRKMIDDLHTEIVKTIEEDKLNEYYLDNGLLLNQYYNSDNKPINNDNKEGILSYFNTSQDEKDKIDDKLLFNKKEVMNEYMCNIDDKIINTKYENIIYDKCESCGSQMLLSEICSELSCSNCGHTKDIIIVTEKNSYADPPREISYFAYKRINHFNEWLAQFQAKESTDIPKEVYDEILIELKKERLSNINNLNPLKIREILKKLKKNKYYEHVPHIINRLNGVPPPVMTRETEEELRRMFKEIQVPFHKFCPKNRKNFLSYSYVLHKFVQLLELDDFLPCFMLLKSREKLHQQDQIWKQICGYLKWQYIPSV